MADPSTKFAGASTGVETTTRAGVAQYRRTWEASEPQALVLLLHGIAEHSGRYEHIGSTLADAGFTTTAFDHHGHGRSGGRRAHVPSFDTFLDDVEDNLVELRESGLPVILMAHSMGGLIALRYCQDGRPLPDVLLLSGPAMGAEVPLWQRVMAPILGRIAPKLFIKSEFDGSLLSTDPDVGEKYHNDPLRIKGATTGLGLALFQGMKAVNEQMKRLSIPTIVVHGSNDRIVPAHFTEPLATMSNVTREELPDLEHEVLNEPNWQTTLDTLILFAKDELAKR